MLKKIWIYILLSIFSILWSTINAQNNWFDDILNKSTENIQQNITYDVVQYQWARNIWNFIVDFIIDYIVPVFLVIAVLVAMFGFFKLMTSNKDWDEKKWVDYILRWVVGIVVMTSASFIANFLYNEITWLTPTSNLNTLVWNIYNSLIYPFLQLFMYIVMWTLFVILLIHMMRFITSADEKVVTHSKNIIINNVIWIVVIMLSKEIVQAVYWEQSTVLRNASNLWDIWSWMLNTSNIKLLYSVINRAMSIIWFIILVIIIYQSYLLLLNPNDDKQRWVIKKNFLYIFIWLVLIWFAYMIVNLLLLN